MKIKLVQLCAELLLLGSGAAQAAITCSSITSPGFTISYAAGTISSSQTFFTITCNRELSGDDSSVNFDVSVNNGNDPAGTANRAALAVNGPYVFYEPYKDSCLTPWEGSEKQYPGLMDWGNALGLKSQTVSFWGCIKTAQAGMPAGTYSDSLLLTVDYGKSPKRTITGSAPVTIYAPAYCTMSMPAGDMVFTYVAFGPQQTPTKTFTATCTNTMPYTLAVSPSSAVVVGLNYSVALNASSAIGTGFPQTFTITGTMAAGQAGECPTSTCSGTQIHTVTVTY
jgi:spore coat protein U-like protein